MLSESWHEYNSFIAGYKFSLLLEMWQSTRILLNICHLKAKSWVRKYVYRILKLFDHPPSPFFTLNEFFSLDPKYFLHRNYFPLEKYLIQWVTFGIYKFQAEICRYRVESSQLRDRSVQKIYKRLYFIAFL